MGYRHCEAGVGAAMTHVAVKGELGSGDSLHTCTHHVNDITMPPKTYLADL